MTDVFPRRNLPIEAEPWGRAHDERVIALEDGVTRLGQSLSGQNRNSASSIQTLADQVKDLVGRVSYNTSSADSQTWTTPSGPYTWGPGLSFTLTEPRVVSLEFSVSGMVYTLASNATSSAVAHLKGAIFLNGSMIPGAQGEMGTNVGVLPNTGRASTYSGTLTARSLVSLTAGTYTVQGGFSTRNAELNGSPPSGSVTVSATSPFIFVDVLQPA